MKLHSALVCFLLIFALLPVVAQTGANDTANRPLTIEELFLSQDVEIQIMRSQALAADRDSKLLALQTIRGRIGSGRVSGNETAVIAVLDALAGEGVYRVVRQGGSVVNNFPDIRRQAAGLLGEIGGENAKNILLKIVADDPEPMVLSEAVYSLGRIGINDPAVTERMVAALRRNTFRVSPDNNFAYATLLAFEQLSTVGPGIAQPDILQALIEVISGNYIEIVKAKALDILSNLRR